MEALKMPASKKKACTDRGMLTVLGMLQDHVGRLNIDSRNLAIHAMVADRDAYCTP
jgi:hypothetical protein